MQFSAWPQQLLAEHIPFLQGKSQVKNWWWGGSRLGPSGLKSNQLNKATQLEDRSKLPPSVKMSAHQGDVTARA